MENITREVVFRLRMEQPRKEKIQEWALVLTALKFSFELEQDAYGNWNLWVEFQDKDRAVEEICEYELEDADRIRAQTEQGHWQGRVEPSLWILLLLMVFYRLTQMEVGVAGETSVDWQELGRIDVLAIHQGQWWRLATSLTLHADLAHLLGNVCIGGLFIVQLCRNLGTGTGWFLVLLSGVLGNLLNVMVQDYAHSSLGGSTAVFGTLGILGGMRSLQGSEERPMRQFMPLAAGLGLLAMLGTGGPRTDVGAHMFGFGSGVFLGLLLGLAWAKEKLPAPAWDTALGLTALGAIAFAWWQALQSYL